MPFTVLASGNGANVGALGTTCAAVGIGPLDDVADWRACVTRTAACQVADAMGLVYPHADALLARIGRARLPAFCPGFVAVPTRTPTPLPTTDYDADAHRHYVADRAADRHRVRHPGTGCDLHADGARHPDGRRS